MAYEEESSFPEELRRKMLKSTGNLLGWRFEDIPRVIKICKELRFAILGGQTEFFLLDGTCELYWLSAEPKEKSDTESWKQYVERSCSEFMELFKALVNNTNFEKEGLEWEFLRKKKESGLNILDYLCFEIQIISEEHYARLNN